VFERYVSVHPANSEGVKPGDSRLLPPFQNGTCEPANMDQFPFSNKAKSSPWWQRVDYKPGEVWFIDGMSPTIAGSLTKGKYPQLCIEYKSQKQIPYPVRDQSAQSYLAFLQQLRRMSNGFTGNKIKVILTDQHPSLLHSKTAGAFRADTCIHMEAVPAGCHTLRGRSEAAIKHAWCGTRLRLWS